MKGFTKTPHLVERNLEGGRLVMSRFIWGDLMKRELSRLKLKPSCLLFTCSYSILPVIL